MGGFVDGTEAIVEEAIVEEAIVEEAIVEGFDEDDEIKILREFVDEAKLVVAAVVNGFEDDETKIISELVEGVVGDGAPYNISGTTVVVMGLMRKIHLVASVDEPATDSNRRRESTNE